MPQLALLSALAAPYRRKLVMGSLLLMAENGVALGIPWLGGLYASGLLGLGTSSQRILLLLLLLLLLQAVLRFVTRSLLGVVSERLIADLRQRLYDHLQKLPVAWFQQNRRSDLVVLMTHDTEHLGGFISGTVVTLLPQLLSLLGAIVLMLALDPLLGFWVAALVPLFFVLLKITGRRLRPLSARLRQSHADCVAFFNQNMELVPVIKAFGREQTESVMFRRHTETMLQLVTREQRIHALLEPGMQFMTAAGVVLLLYLAGERIAIDTMQPQQLVTFLLYAALLTRPVSVLAAVYGDVQMTRVVLARLQTVLDEKQEDLASGQTMVRARGEIVLDKVCFAYPDRELVLKDASLHIAARETVAITGENGVGKSTLVHLLLRFLRPQSGCILLDGQNIETISLQSLRCQFALVAQNVLLFNSTIAANIGYARPDASQHDIEHVARLAKAHDFICNLPDGYQTMIGEQGVRLSGGQRQRLALARALLKDAPILLLDEVTAMFDPEGERALIEECHDLFAQRTVILITHRPASLALADRVVRLNNGALQQVGCRTSDLPLAAGGLVGVCKS